MARLAHHVFFLLKDQSEEKVNSLIAACREFLEDHPGVIGFDVGTREAELDRPVNVVYDVSLHVIFADRSSHDVYQTAPRHLQFIEQQKENWAQVRVFDSNLL